MKVINQRGNLFSFAKLPIFLFFFIFILMIFVQFVYAISASPHRIEVYQPDGTKINLHIRGDEYFHWFEDIDGFTVLRDNNRYVYAKLDSQGKLVSTNYLVGKTEPVAVGLKRRMLPSAEDIRAQSISRMGPASVQDAPQKVNPSGNVKNLVVLCMFSDHTAGVDTRSQADYFTLFNQVGGDPTLAPTGSVKDYYYETSYGTMTLDSSVTIWVTLPHTEAFYAAGSDGLGGSYPRNAQGMVKDALDLIDPMVDFSQFDTDSDNYIDSIDIIHSGYGGETGGGGGNWIWSHRWSLYQVPGGKWTSNEGVKVYDYHTEPALWGSSGNDIVRIGVIAHETGHFFGLPDLYDIDYDGEGIGSWGLMANSWGFDWSQLHPPHFCAWSKIQLGWLTPQIITSCGEYIAPQVETNPTIFRIDQGYPSDEYLLIENRQPVGFETDIPQGGLCIYHIDDSAGYDTQGYPGQAGWPENGNHYRVALLQADGNYNLEKNNNRGDSGDVYHAGGVSIISDSTVPNTDAYQNGNIITTYNTLSSISSAGSIMNFVFSYGGTEAPSEEIYSFTLDTDPGWTTQGQWQFGIPLGAGGQYGNPDPTSGYTGNNVYGYNLAGDYSNNIPAYYLQTPALDCSNYQNVELEFWRWLNVERPLYDHANIQVSNDGVFWTTVWENTDEIMDSSWTKYNYNISSVADNQATVYIRWGMGPTDISWQYSGWNIDDIKFIGTPIPIKGDLDTDYDVDWFDFEVFASWWKFTTCNCTTNDSCDGADIEQNGNVDFLDLSRLTGNWLVGTIP